MYIYINIMNLSSSLMPLWKSLNLRATCRDTVPEAAYSAVIIRMTGLDAKTDLDGG